MSSHQRVTIHDVAEMAGVSTGTVSKVLNGKDGFSRATGARVRAAADQLGYESSLVARSLRQARTHVLGVLVPDFGRFSLEVLKGAADGVRGSGYELIVYSPGGHDVENAGWERRYLGRIGGTLVDGALLATPSERVSSALAVVAIEPLEEGSPVPVVRSDVARGGELAADHLIGLGHRRIAVITSGLVVNRAWTAERGYHTAMSRAGLPRDHALVISGARPGAELERALRRLLERSDRPTAVLAETDALAHDAIEAARRIGFNVPTELSVVGYGNAPDASSEAQNLTTVETPAREMGRRAVAMLLDQILEDARPRDLIVPPRLVVRTSTTAAPLWSGRRSLP